MSMSAAMGQLNDARKVMLARWQAMGGVWRDPASQRFEQTFIERIDRDLRKTITSLNETAGVIDQARRDCS